MRRKRLILSATFLLVFALTGLHAQQSNSKTAGATVTDIDGNIYHAVTIGTQTWLVENLKTTKYRNGDLIGTTSPATLDYSNELTPKYQFAYNGDENYVATYGRLYTWYALTDSRKICPIGWHVSTDKEWTTMVNFLGDSVVGDKIRESGTMHWNSPNKGATNESGFTALAAGSRWSSAEANKPIFVQLGEVGHYWTDTASEEDSTLAYRWLIMPWHTIQTAIAKKSNGWPVRCIKD
jgi:uncharacterized protein (TIGR02145 family)